MNWTTKGVAALATGTTLFCGMGTVTAVALTGHHGTAPAGTAPAKTATPAPPAAPKAVVPRTTTPAPAPAKVVYVPVPASALPDPPARPGDPGPAPRRAPGLKGARLCAPSPSRLTAAPTATTP